MKNLPPVFLSFFLTIHLAAQSSWHYLPNAPNAGGWRIDDVFFLDSQRGWCATSNGKIYKTSNGGHTWEKRYDSNSYFRCIEFYNDSIGYAGSLDAKFLRTTNGGQSWTNLAPSITPLPSAVCGISIPDSLVAYAVGQWDSPAFFLKTTNGGQSWTRTNMNQYAKALVDVFFINRDTGFVSGEGFSGAVILHTTDGGATWSKKFDSQTPGQYVWKIQRVTPECWVGSIQTFGGGKFVKSFDEGMSWVEKAAPIPDMQGIGFATPQHGWVGGYVNGFYETFDGGDSWAFQDFGGNFNRFYFLDSTLAYASGESVYKFFGATPSETSQPVRREMQDDGFTATILPNPSDGVFKVNFYLPVRDNLRMSIFSAEGALLREVYHERQVAPGEHQFRVDCSDLPAGAYFLGIQRNHGLYAKPFAKQ